MIPQPLKEEFKLTQARKDGKSNDRRFASQWNERMYKDLKAVGVTQTETAEYLGISLTAYNTVLRHFHFGITQRRKLTELLEKARKAQKARKQIILEGES